MTDRYGMVRVSSSACAAANSFACALADVSTNEHEAQRGAGRLGGELVDLAHSGVQAAYRVAGSVVRAVVAARARASLAQVCIGEEDEA
eukprot:6502228-Prymnesium_polylepis.2